MNGSNDNDDHFNDDVLDDDGGDNNNANGCTMPMLRASLLFLYSLQGLTMQLPTLALLAVVNDRVAVPPAYLSAYGAICFLPSSLKPLWATLSTMGMLADAPPRDKLKRVQLMLALMLLANGMSFYGTALLVPVNGIMECFVWGFLRGVTSAWSNFLLDQLLILQAKTLSSHQETSSLSYQAISSHFQAKAATYRQVGSLLASIGTFGLFLWRQNHRDSSDTEPTLSHMVVMALLLGSGAASAFGAFVLIICQSERSERRVDLIEREGQRYDSLAVPAVLEEDIISHDEPISGRRSQYQSLSIEDDSQSDCNPTSLEEQASSSIDGESTTNQQQSFQKKSDIATLGLLQLLLIGGAVRRPVSSLDQGSTVWESIMLILSLSFVFAVIISSVSATRMRKQNQDVIVNEQTEYESEARKNRTIPPRSLGIYLIIRYAVPIASFIMYAYVYDIFGKREPLFMQTLLILETGVALLASWVYTNFFAPRFHSGWAMIALLAILTGITSLVSLLDIYMVHARNNTEDIDASLRWIVASITLVKYFMGNINHLPNIVLATVNVVSPSETQRNDNHHDEDTNRRKNRSDYDEGIQYATFMSCINFGAQLGDWISVPIIAAYGITRENKWENLDKYIILCALLRLTSILALYIIRPTRTK